ncbi:hypothetical protein J2128_001344 [Methanomicrobium sp. W14]|uniref:hypothetical protein n=1 Tax=Methanomicrobium sp. W14 TaxID=2817839 RepID=UPI001AE5A84B|nr:hypothetical protein [Methanomicrobium sp. W14]MBP2133390.1 hypothetical protein [Methanomicrobium sp. W14]
MKDVLPGLNNQNIKKIWDIARILELKRKTESDFNNVHIIPAISTFRSAEEFFKSLDDAGFRVDGGFGKLLYISKELGGDRVVFYVFYDESTNISLFITTAKKSKEIPDVLFKYINHERNISNLWISPCTMKEIKDDLSGKYEKMMITYFSARRGTSTDIKAEIRPEISRSIIYRGLDGKKTLEELEYYYGVLPKILEIKLPNGVHFKIDNKGIITLNDGRFDEIFKILDYIIEKIITVKNAINESEYKIFNIGKNKQFRHALQKPWSVIISRNIDIGSMPKICKSFNSEEWNFTLLESVLISGSLLFTARLIDNYSGTKFDISMIGNRIDIFPVDETDIGSSIRFYEFILENIDNSAITG